MLLVSQVPTVVHGVNVAYLRGLLEKYPTLFFYATPDGL